MMPTPIRALHGEVAALTIGGTVVLVRYIHHPEKGDLPSYYEIHRVELAGEERNLFPLLDELDVISYIEAQLSLKDMK